MLLASGRVNLSCFLLFIPPSITHTYAVTADQNLQLLKFLILLIPLILYYSEHLSCMEKNCIRVKIRALLPSCSQCMLVVNWWISSTSSSSWYSVKTGDCSGRMHVTESYWLEVTYKIVAICSRLHLCVKCVNGSYWLCSNKIWGWKRRMKLMVRTFNKSQNKLM